MNFKGMLGGALTGAPMKQQQAGPMGGIAQQQGYGAGVMMQPEQQQQPKRGVGDFLSDFVINYGAASGNPFANSILQQRAHQQQSIAQQQQQQQQYEQERVDRRAEKQWEWDNKPNTPDVFTQRMIAAGIDPTSEQGKGLYRQKVENDAMDWIEVSDGMGGKRIVPRPSAAPPQTFGADLPPGFQVQGGPASAPGNFPVSANKLDAITAQSESGNRHSIGGRVVTSPAGALGRMQVMPGTARDPGFGIRPARDNSDAELTRVGREYRSKMEQRYGGDPAKMWAAYNWGPGNLDAALQKYGNDWLRYAPQETQNYIRKNIAALRG